MPLSIPNTTLQDGYVEATTFAGGDVFAWGFFTVANNPAFVQLAQGPLGQAVFQPEIYCPPATYPIAGGERIISGIRARNAVAGSIAQFFGSMFYPKEPGIQAGTPFLGQVSASGGIITPTGSVSLIQSQLLAAPAANIDFLTIPQIYFDLVVVLSGRGTTVATAVGIGVQLNGDAGANYSQAFAGSFGGASATGSSVGDVSGRVGVINAATAPANIFSQLEFSIDSYTTTDRFKSWVGTSPRRDTGLAGGQGVELSSGFYVGSVAAITSLRLIPGAGNFAAGTRASLYGRGG